MQNNVSEAFALDIEGLDIVDLESFEARAGAGEPDLPDTDAKQVPTCCSRCCTCCTTCQQ